MSNAHCKRAFGLLQLLPGNFRSNDVTSGSLPITTGYLTSFRVTWLPPPASYRLVASETLSIREFSAFYSLLEVSSGKWRHFWVTSGHQRSPDIISCHLTRLPASHSLVGSEMHSICEFSAFYSHFQVTSGQMTSLPGHFQSPEVTWQHLLFHDCFLLRATALYKVKSTGDVSFRPSTACTRWLPVHWRHFRVSSGL